MTDPIVESWPEEHVVRENPDVAALVRAVLAYPDDDVPRKVLADKLLETGRDDARCWATLIMSQCLGTIESTTIRKTGASNGNWSGWDTGKPVGTARDELSPKEWRLAFRTAAPKAVFSHNIGIGGKECWTPGAGLYSHLEVSRGFVSMACIRELDYYGDGVSSVAFCPGDAPCFRRLAGHPVDGVTFAAGMMWENAIMAHVMPYQFTVVGTPDDHWGSWCTTDGTPSQWIGQDLTRMARPNIRNMLPRILTWPMSEVVCRMPGRDALCESVGPAATGPARGGRIPYWLFRTLAHATAAVRAAGALHVTRMRNPEAVPV